jgi:hypothetical protein
LLREALLSVLRRIEQVRDAEPHSPAVEPVACWADDGYSYIEAELPELDRRSRVDISCARGRVLIRSSRETGCDGLTSG